MEEGAVSTVEHAGFTLSGTDDGKATSEALKARDAERAAAAEDAPGDDRDPVSKAASELGKRGGDAAAKAKAKAAKAKAAAEPAEKAEPEEAEDAEGAPRKAEAKEGEPEGEKAEEHRSRARQRVEEATRAAAAARREAEEAKREAAALRARLETAPKPPAPEGERHEAPPRHEATGKPKAEDFEDYDQYLDARDAWNRQEWQRETEERTREQRKQERITSLATSFRDRVRAEGPTFLTEEVSEAVRALKPSFALEPGTRPSGGTFLADALLFRSEHAPALMRYLTEHADDFERIAALASPYDVAYEVGRIVARLEGATAGEPPSDERPAAKPASKAPPPVRPVTGEPGAAPIGFREGMSFDEWLATNPKKRPRAAQ